MEENENRLSNAMMNDEDDIEEDDEISQKEPRLSQSN